MKHIKGLDTLRAFAVFFVIIAHNGVWFDDTVLNGHIIKDIIIPDGSFGVYLFFVLSGFLITSILLKERTKADGAVPLSVAGNFFARRTLRIFPAYYILLLLLYKIDYKCIRADFPYYVSYLGNVLCYKKNEWTCFCHSWSLGVEEQFYLLWPWLILYVRDKYLKYVFPLAIIIGVGSTFYSVAITHHIAPFLVFNCFDAFGIGGLYAYAMLNERTLQTFNRMLKAILPFAISGYFYIHILIFLSFANIPGLFLIKTIDCILAVWIIKLVITNRSRIVARYLLENRVLNFLGRISYGIYLYHFVYNGVGYERVNDFIKRVCSGYPVFRDTLLDHHYNYWLQIGVVILISWLSYIVIEKPFLLLKRFFNYRKAPVLPGM